MASKGLDFPGVEHVILYDMPQDMATYVHQIGRTARGASTTKGRSTVMIVARETPESLLVELRQVLQDAKQKVPQFMLDLQ